MLRQGNFFIETLKKIIIRLFLVGLLLYGAACAWLYYSQDSLLYFPTPAAPSENIEKFTLKNERLQLKGLVINPNKANALIYFGGNGEAIEHLAGFFKTTLPDTTVYLLPYRGYGGNPGKPSEAALFSDALALYDQIAPHHIRLRTMGRSLGSGVASYLASQRNIDKLILVTPYDSILNVAQKHYPLFPIPWLLKDPYESWRFSPKITADVLVLIAGNDETIPRERTDNLLRHFIMQKPQVRVFKDADHVSISDVSGYNQAISKFVEE
jgi:uncharacterized protein